MKVTFQYTQDEYARAFWMNSRKRRNPKLDTVMIIVTLVFGGWSLMEGKIFWGWLALGTAGLLIGLLTAGRFFIPYFVYNRYIRNRGEYTLDFTQDGIHFKTTNIDSNLNWSMYTHVLSGPEHYLLYYGKDQYTIIPRRVFESPDQLHAFDRLLKQKVKSVKTL